MAAGMPALPDRFDCRLHIFGAHVCDRTSPPQRQEYPPQIACNFLALSLLGDLWVGSKENEPDIVFDDGPECVRPLALVLLAQTLLLERRVLALAKQFKPSARLGAGLLKREFAVGA
jgi:hypothetical protein